MEARVARLRQARSDEAARLLGRLEAELAGTHFDWWQRPPAAEVTFDDDLLDGDLTAEQIVNRHIARHRADQLHQRVAKELSLPREGFSDKRVKGGILIRRGETKMILVQATRAHLYLTNETKHGNFLMEGTQWRPLRPVLRLVSVCAPAPAEQSHRIELGSLTLMRDWPGLPDGMVEAQSASARIRDDRRRAFDQPMIFHLSTGATVRLDPIRRVDGALGLPFSYRQDTDAESLLGVLRVRSPNEILPVEVPNDHDPDVLLAGWLTVLRVFADLTTGNDPAGPGSSKMPPTFTPTPATAKVLNHYVIGHRRREYPEFRPAQRRRDLAAAHGIELPPAGYTWVKPYRRGSAPDQPLEFHWSANPLSP
jgi:hypothetical protein